MIEVAPERCKTHRIPWSGANTGDSKRLTPIGMVNNHLDRQRAVLILPAEDENGIPHLFSAASSHALTHMDRKRFRANTEVSSIPSIAANPEFEVAIGGYRARVPVHESPPQKADTRHFTPSSSTFVHIHCIQSTT